MKIGLVTPSLVWQGGGERQLLYLARGLREKGHKVVIYAGSYDERRCYPELARGLAIKACHCRPARTSSLPPFIGIYLYYFKLFINLKRMAGMIDRETDIINVHGEGLTWLILRLSPFWKGKFIWMCNDSPTWIEVFKKREGAGLLRRLKNFLDRVTTFRLLSYYDRRAVRGITAIVVLSQEMKRSLELYYGRRVNLLRSGIDIERFNQLDGSFIRKRYRISPRDFLLLHLSSLQPLRRAEEAILAIDILKKDYPFLKMLIVGSLSYYPQYVQGLKKLIRERRLEADIVLTGEAIDQELPLYYGASDGFIFPSDGRQSWGLVVFEAMAARKPVIVSRCCGASEILRDEREALFITPGDIQGIASQIRRLIENEGLRRLLAEQGYNFVKENLSWSRYVEGMEEIFSQA